MVFESDSIHIQSSYDYEKNKQGAPFETLVKLKLIPTDIVDKVPPWLSFQAVVCG